MATLNIAHFEDEPWDSGLAHYALTLAAEQKRRGNLVLFAGLRNSPVTAAARELGLSCLLWSEGIAGWFELAQTRRRLMEFKPHILNAHTGTAHARAVLTAPKNCAIIRTRADARLPQANALTNWVAKKTATIIAANSLLESALHEAFPFARTRRVLQGLEGPAQTTPLPETPTVGILARLDPVKGHEVVLDAARIIKTQVPNVQILCAGEGVLLDRLRWQLPALGLADTMKFLGRVPDARGFINSCRVGVVASIGSEAVSRAAIEWMAAGRPLVATRVGGLPDIVEDGVTGLLVAPENPEALARAVSDILMHPRRAELMGQQARQNWQTRMTPQIFADHTEQVYDEARRDIPR